MGIHRTHFAHSRVCRVHVPWIQNSEESALSILAADSGGNNSDRRDNCVPSHRSCDWTPVDNVIDAAVRFLWPIEHGAVTSHDGNPGKHWQHEGEGDRLACN